MIDKNTLFKSLPKIDRLTAETALKDISPEVVKMAARKVLDDIRTNTAEKGASVPGYEQIVSMVSKECARLRRGTLYKVINATGVPVHTNLGRSPIPEDVVTEAVQLASGYSNLEYDVAKGKRGDRYHHVSEYLRMLTGGEDALIVNNNASAVFLILNTFCKNKEAIVSRGELVEIGGSFRIPDVMSRSGAKLKEVGTTNKTRISDYTEAVSSGTSMMMKVHRSNYEIVGFSEEVTLSELASAARENGVLSYYDAGSGLFTKAYPDGVCDDETIPAASAKGFDLISFSGDKMLGGCQAGIIIGKAELIKKLKKNPLMRMLRVDKLTLGILQAVFRKYIEKDADSIPVNRMLSADINELKAKAEKLSAMLPCDTEVVQVSSTIGGGSCPMSEMDSWGVALRIGSKKPQTVEKLLRGADTPVIARITDEKIVLDVRTIDESEFGTVCLAVEAIV